MIIAPNKNYSEGIGSRIVKKTSNPIIPVKRTPKNQYLYIIPLLFAFLEVQIAETRAIK